MLSLIDAGRVVAPHTDRIGGLAEPGQDLKDLHDTR
jgi:hypothetical protein